MVLCYGARGGVANPKKAMGSKGNDPPPLWGNSEI